MERRGVGFPLLCWASRCCGVIALIDVHAHYFPTSLLEALESHGAGLGISLSGHPPACQQCLQFAYGLKVRPFPAGLVEAPEKRLARMDGQGISRQILSGWTDIFGYGLPSEKGAHWHRFMNDALSGWCEQHPERFSWLASGALPDAALAAHELERAVKSGGAVGGVVAANIEGGNLGEFDLDEFWAAACELDVPVFIHPMGAEPAPRTRFFALNPIAQYTFDTTVTVGSLIGSGVLDRFPKLNLILSHGGGSLPYLIGRFDCLNSRSDPDQTKAVSRHLPSGYLDRFHYDCIVHGEKSLRFLADVVSTRRLVLGTDDSFPPADLDPIGNLRKAGFDEKAIAEIGNENPRRLFKL
jgi:aminocarboxymuconate-semialdehyde decarboxylase